MNLASLRKGSAIPAEALVLIARMNSYGLIAIARIDPYRLIAIARQTYILLII